MFLDKRMHPAILAFAAFAVVVLPVGSLGRDPLRVKSDKVLLNGLVSCEQPWEQLNKDEQTNMQLHSYVEETSRSVAKTCSGVERNQSGCKPRGARHDPPDNRCCRG